MVNTLSGAEKSRKIDWKYVILHIVIAVFYLLFFYIILESSYSADDIFNANAAAANYREGDSVWQLTLRQWKLWFENGRFYPFSNYTYLLFSIASSRFTYKLLLLISVYLNAVLMSRCVRYVTDSKLAAVLSMVLLPFSMQLTPRWDGPLYCYHMLMQIVMLGSELSLLACFHYLKDEKQNKKHYIWLILGALAYMIALGTYENAYIMAAFLGLGVWAYTGSVKKTLQTLLPDILVYIGMLIMNIAARIRYSGGGYDGITINLDPNRIGNTFLKQLYSTMPLAGYLANRHAGIAEGVRTFMSQLRWTDIVMTLAYVFLVIIAYHFYADETKTLISGRRIWFLLFMGVSMMVFPSALMSLMAKYQNELVWGQGHISNYMQNYGLMLVLLSILLALTIYTTRYIKNVVTVLMIILGIPVLLWQEWEARLDAEFRYMHFGYCRDAIIQAAELGIFHNIDPDDVIYGMSDYVYDNAQTDSFYTLAAKKQIQGRVKGEFLPMLIDQYGNQEVYDLTGSSPEVYVAKTGADASGGYMILGKVVSVTMNDDQNQFTTIILQDPYIYITGESPLDIEGLDIVNQNKKGSLYYEEGFYSMP